jgi:hypothetical protein
MIPHPYIYEKMYASRHAEIQKEMQHARLVAQVAQRPTYVRLTAYTLGKSLIALGSYMQQAGQKRKASFRTS